VILSVCPFAIETTFPLSNFKTKHIFGILITLRKFFKLWAPQAPPKRGAEGARNMGRRGRPKFFFFHEKPNTEEKKTCLRTNSQRLGGCREWNLTLNPNRSHTAIRLIHHNLRPTPHGQLQWTTELSEANGQLHIEFTQKSHCSLSNPPPSEALRK